MFLVVTEIGHGDIEYDNAAFLYCPEKKKKDMISTSLFTLQKKIVEVFNENFFSATAIFFCNNPLKLLVQPLIKSLSRYNRQAKYAPAHNICIVFLFPSLLPHYDWILPNFDGLFTLIFQTQPSESIAKQHSIYSSTLS